MKTVSVLCAATPTIYRFLDGVDIWNEQRDVRYFQSDNPVVCHPPCRSWSAFTRHQAKPKPGEKELGPLCVEWLKRNGGVLEHPAFSLLYEYCELPLPGETRDGLTTFQVNQCDWGHKCVKRTWVCFSKVDVSSLVFPAPRVCHNSWRTFALMNRLQRSHTPLKFAHWLVNAARSV